MISNPSPSFVEWPKLARLNREAIWTEKLDGTSSQVFIWNEDHLVDTSEGKVPAGKPPTDVPWIRSEFGLHLAAGSRTKWITPSDDNYGFARWVEGNAAELAKLGHGRHYGEWWGQGIQRGYDLKEKRLSLFNVSRWCLHGQTPQRIVTADPRVEKYQEVLPPCVGLVPVLARGLFSTVWTNFLVEQLRANGSVAVPGFMKPEGLVCWHTAANQGFKVTLVKDEVPKSLA